MSNKITLLIFTVLFSFTAFANFSKAEKEVLIKLNQATNGAKWINKWDLSLPMEKWYGVKVVDDKVVSINLNNNNLTGRIPVEITTLLNLQELNLGTNLLNGEIPLNIGNMKNLEVLDLSFNKMTGFIPPSMCTLPNLRVLLLDRNIFSGELPPQIGKLSMLESLSLYENSFQ